MILTIDPELLERYEASLDPLHPEAGEVRTRVARWFGRDYRIILPGPIAR